MTDRSAEELTVTELTLRAHRAYERTDITILIAFTDLIAFPRKADPKEGPAVIMTLVIMVSLCATHS